MKKKISVISVAFIIISLVTLSGFANTSKVSTVNKNSESILKYAQTNNQISTSSSASKRSVSTAFKRVNDEEKYVVSLINELSEEETTLSDWKNNLKFLKENYKSILENSEKLSTNMVYIDSYIEAYENVLLAEKYPTEKSKSYAIRTNETYNVNNGVDYARKYYSNYNSAEYPSWNIYGGDCANFVSQCLRAGGKEMKGTPGTSDSAQNFSNWFSVGTSLNVKNVSSTWRGADAFRNYWQNNSVQYKKFSSYTYATYDYGFRGDAVSLLTDNGRAFHTLYVVGYSRGDLIFSAHTSETINGSLKSATQQFQFIIYNMSL